MKRIIKIIISLGLIILACTNIIHATEIDVKSEISEVSVYIDSALINRLARLELTSGVYEAVFSDIVPEVDENSLRVSAGGSATVKLFGAKVEKEYLEEVPSERIKQLKEEIQGLEDQISGIINLRNVLAEKKKFLNSITLFSGQQIPQDLVTNMPQIDDLENLLSFLDEGLKENYRQSLDYEIEMRGLESKVETLKRELSQISGMQRKLKRSIVVELEVLKEGTIELQVSYLVKGASWNPIYDARADFEISQVGLISYGVIRQITGEDWKEVFCSLSTAKPRIGGSMPYVAPWFLRPYQPVVSRDKMPAAPSVAYQTEAFKKEVGAVEEPVEAEIEFATTEEKGIAVIYKLPSKVSVKSDKSENKFPISSQNLPAVFEYSSYPRISPFAYLGSRVTNSEGLQLLAGRVNIFLEGDFVGFSNIGNIAPSEEFDLYLGIDENVKVKRECLEKKVDETLIAGIPSRTKRITYKYRLSVENYKSKLIKVKLFEAIPVSEDDRIKIKINEVSLEPNVKDWEDRKGIWLWELELEPRQKQEIFYTFTVEHPRDMEVEGL